MSTSFFIDLISHFKGNKIDLLLQLLFATEKCQNVIGSKSARSYRDMYRDVASCISLALLARFYNYIKKCVHLTTAARRSVAMQQRDNVGLGSSSKGSPPMPFSLSPSLSLSYCCTDYNASSHEDSVRRL